MSRIVPTPVLLRNVAFVALLRTNLNIFVGLTTVLSAVGIDTVLKSRRRRSGSPRPR